MQNLDSLYNEKGLYYKMVNSQQIKSKKSPRMEAVHNGLIKNPLANEEDLMKAAGIATEVTFRKSSFSDKSLRVEVRTKINEKSTEMQCEHCASAHLNIPSFWKIYGLNKVYYNLLLPIKIIDK